MNLQSARERGNGKLRPLLVFLLFICIASGAAAAQGDINTVISNIRPGLVINAPNGGESVRESYPIDINIFDPNNDELHTRIAYSSSPGIFEHDLVSDMNLNADLNIIDLTCETTNWSTPTRCLYYWNTTDINGRFFIDINVWDIYGDFNINSSDANFSVNIAPAIFSVIITDNNGFTNDSTPPIDINASADAVDMNLSCSPNGPWKHYGAFASHVEDFDISSFDYNCLDGTDGPFSVYVKVGDALGGWGKSSFDSSYYDTTGPVVTITSPADGSSTTSLDITVIYSGEDAGSGIQDFWISPDGTNWTIKHLIEYHTYAGQELGTHTYYVKATDNLDQNGNVASASVSITSSGGGAVCGNGLCEAGEDAVNCCGDCGNCGGEPTLQTCSTLGGQICSDSESCPRGFAPASDTQRCCLNSCVPSGLTCSAQGGDICLAQELCSGQWLTAIDTSSCCSAECAFKADLSAIMVAPSRARPDSTVSIVVTVYNYGGAPSGSFDVGLYRILGADKKLFSQRALASVSAGDAVSLQFSFDYAPSADPDMNRWAYNNVTFEVALDYLNSVDETDEQNNTVQRSIAFGGPERCGNALDDDFDSLIDEDCGIPNLFIKRSEIGKPKFSGDELVKVDFNIVVSDDYADVLKRFDVSFFKGPDDKGEVSVVYIDTIKKGDEIVLMYRWQAPTATVFRLSPAPDSAAYFQEGAPLSSFYVFVDYLKRIGEVSKADNFQRIDIEAIFPDLAFQSLSLERIVFFGEPLSIDANVINLGSDDSGQFAVALYVDGELKGSSSIASLAPNSSQKVNFLLQGLSSGRHDINIVIDPLLEVSESNEQNNRKGETIYVLGSPNEIYSYEKFLQQEPLFVGLWDEKESPGTYLFSVLTPMPVIETIRDRKFNDSYDFVINKLRSSLLEIRPAYSLKVSRNSEQFASHNFSLIARTKDNAFRQADELTVLWWLNPIYLKRMHYTRITSLEYIFWQAG